MCIQNIPFCIITRCKIWDLVWRANAKLGSISWPPDTPPHKFHPNFIIARMSWDVGALWHNQIYGTVSQGPLHRELRSHVAKFPHTHTIIFLFYSREVIMIKRGNSLWRCYYVSSARSSSRCYSSPLLVSSSSNLSQIFTPTARTWSVFVFFLSKQRAEMNEIFQKVSAAETEDLLAGHQSICAGNLQNISNLLSTKY